MMQLALLGKGNEVEAAYASLLMSGHSVNYMSCPSLYSKVSGSGVTLVQSHKDLSFDKVSNVLLISYGDLIKNEFLEKALFMNVHYALLPKYRGMHPVQWAIINGERSFGYTLHLVNERIDAGNIIHQEKIDFSDSFGYGDVVSGITQRLKETLGAALLSFEKNKACYPQNEKIATFFVKRTIDDGFIDWEESAQLVLNLVQALRPPEMPGAFFFYKGKRMVVHSASVVDMVDYIGPVGRIINIGQEGDVWVKCGKGTLSLKTLSCGGVPLPAQSWFTQVGIRLNRGN